MVSNKQWSPKKLIRAMAERKREPTSSQMARKAARKVALRSNSSTDDEIGILNCIFPLILH